MGIGKQERLHRCPAIAFWTVTTLLFVLGTALRWWRLDLMSFNFDQAAICERAMELFAGRIPFTGIVNSMGFRNAPGYVWSLLPAFFLTCNPLVTTAWHGLLCASMVFPLAMIGRRFRRDGLAYLPAILAACLPTEILAGRTLWAQYLVTPFAAWGLWALIYSLDERRTLIARQKFGAAALAIMAWVVSIHYGAAPLLVIAVFALWKLFCVSTRRGKALLIVPMAIISTTMIPSVVDFIYRLSNPLPKPTYALKFDAELPDVLPWWARITQAASASVLNSSQAEPIFQVTLSPAAWTWLHSYDVVILLCLVSGLISCLWQMQTRRNSAEPLSKIAALLLLVWIAFPILIGGIFLKRIQPSYFAASLPAGWLSVLFLPMIPKRLVRLNPLPYVVAFIVAGGGIWTTSEFLRVVSTRKIVAASYYIPFRWQTQIADYLSANGVAPQHVQHLSGPVFEKPFVYLVDCRGNNEDSTSADQNYAVLVEHALMEDMPGRLAFMRNSDATKIGPSYIKILPSRGAAEIFCQKYYAILD